MDTLDYLSHLPGIEHRSNVAANLLTVDIIENRTFDELVIGDTAQIVRRFTEDDIEVFANVSGDVNPTHLDHGYADGTVVHGVTAHSMLGGSLFSTVLGTMLPGPGTIYLAQDLRFRRQVKPGDTLTARVVVRETHADENRVVLDCMCTNQDGREVISGTAEVIAPTEKVRRERMAMPEVSLVHHAAYDNLLTRAGGLPPLPTAVVHPCTRDSLQGAIEAAVAGFIAPILVGPEAKIRATAAAARLDLSGIPIVNTDHSHASAETAVALARDGKVKALMKGSLHTDELMHEVMRRENRLRTERRISHAYVMLLPASPKPLILSDCAVNIAPELADKVDIVQNAIDLAIALGFTAPKVALLCAVETVTARMQSTLDAAALCKMADRGQIRGGLLDGPLAFDNAVSADAARKKGIVSAVAGDPDILIVPNLEAGNMLAKQMTFSGGADAAGIVLGASVPIILTSRADSVRTRLASCAVAVLVARHPRNQ
jgi:phosphate acetyltransferase